MAVPSNLPQKEYVQGMWSFEDNFNDSSPNANHLTETSGTIPFVEGKIGKGADFEAGDTEYLTISDASQTGLDITGNITINIWFKPESTGIRHSLVSKYNVATGGRSYRIFVDDSGNKFSPTVSSDGSDYTLVTGTTSLSAGSWYMLTFVYDGSKIYNYMNGSSDADPVNYSSGIYDSTTAFMIGAYLNAGSPTFYADGLIDEVIVWNTALTSGEISDLYAITEYQYKKSAGFFAFFCESWQRHDKLWRNNKLILPKDLGFSY